MTDLERLRDERARLDAEHRELVEAVEADPAMYEGMSEDLAGRYRAVLADEVAVLARAVAVLRELVASRWLT